MASLSPDLAEYIHQKVASGQFASPDEFTAEAVRLYREMEERHELLKADVQAALKQSEEGLVEPHDMDTIKQKLMDKLDEQGRDK